MIVLGETGGVGSGKSAVLHYIYEKYNADIILTDNLAKSMMSEDEELGCKLKSAFNNDDIYDNNGVIIKEKLADLVFNNKDKLNELNSIVHPCVKQRIIDIIDAKQNDDKTELFLVEAALLLEDNYDELFDCIYIYADREVRIERLAINRGYSREKSEAVMANQLPDETFFKRCKYVIDNSGEFDKTVNIIDEFLTGKLGLEKKHG